MPTPGYVTIFFRRFYIVWWLNNSLANRHSSNTTKMGMSFVYWSRKNPSGSCTSKAGTIPYTMIPNSNSPLLASRSSLSPGKPNRSGRHRMLRDGREMCQTIAVWCKQGKERSDQLRMPWQKCLLVPRSPNNEWRSWDEWFAIGYPFLSLVILYAICRHDKHLMFQPKSQEMDFHKVLNTLTFLATVSA